MNPGPTENSMEFEKPSTSGPSAEAKELDEKISTALKRLNLGEDVEDPGAATYLEWAFTNLCGKVLNALLAGEIVSDPWFHSENYENRACTDPDYYDGNSSEEMFADPLDLDFDQLSIGEDLPDWTVQEELDYNYEQLPMPRRYG
jgi:hypothetical protein